MYESEGNEMAEMSSPTKHLPCRPGTRACRVTHCEWHLSAGVLFNKTIFTGILCRTKSLPVTQEASAYFLGTKRRKE